SGWATKIKPGPANESSQQAVFLVSNDNKSLFSSQPTISPDGKLKFTPAQNANGSAKVTVRLKDDGGTANRGRDTSDSETFTITVKPVNDSPSFFKGANQTAPKSSAVQTIKPWATAISPGPADEKKQKVAFQVTTDNPSLFSVPPTISPDGILVYMPAKN